MLKTYIESLSWMDLYLILPYGGSLFLAHLICFWGRWKRYLWAVQGLEKRRAFLLALSELLPLLGLLGTVFGLLQTFKAVAGIQIDDKLIYEIFQNFAPALTTTASGILMLLPNLFMNGILKLLTPDRKIGENK